MKRSNIIIISAVLLPLGWLLLSGWLQANAFNIIKSGKSCSYAGIMGSNNIEQLPSFKNINIDFENHSMPPRMDIKYGKTQEVGCSKNIKKDITFSVSGDTLYLRINYKAFDSGDYITISVPLLKSVTFSSDPENTWSYTSIFKTTISGFKANTLSINNNCQYELQLYDNKLNKLELKGEFYNNGKVDILNCSDYDSLDVNIQGKHGTLSLKSYNSRLNENQKQWISIKVPRTFRIEADASIFLASKITIKK